MLIDYGPVAQTVATPWKYKVKHSTSSKEGIFKILLKRYKKTSKFSLVRI